MIYTSGSTGRPKGVMIGQRGAVNLYQWWAAKYGLSEQKRNLIISSNSFDLTQKNFMATIISGGTIVLSRQGTLEGQDVLNLLWRDQINLVNCAPSQLYPAFDVIWDAKGDAGAHVAAVARARGAGR